MMCTGFRGTADERSIARSWVARCARGWTGYKSRFVAYRSDQWYILCVNGGGTLVRRASIYYAQKVKFFFGTFLTRVCVLNSGVLAYCHNGCHNSRRAVAWGWQVDTTDADTWRTVVIFSTSCDIFSRVVYIDYTILLYNIIHRVRRKWNHSIFAPDFVKCWPIFKILSPTGLALYFQ